MATVTHRVATASTTNATTYASGSFTPAANDLIVAMVRAGATVAPGLLTSSVTGLTFSKVTHATFATSAHRVYIFVANAPATNTSQTVTFDCTGDAADGAVIFVATIDATRYGMAAVRQSAKADNGAAASTPAATFSSAALTGNVCLGIVGNGANPAALTPPSSWTEDAAGDSGYATPASGAEYAYRNSGETGTTITWGSSSGTTHGEAIVEIDTTTQSSGITQIQVLENADWMATTNNRDVVVANATNGDKLIAIGGGDHSSGNTVSSPTFSTQAGTTSAWTTILTNLTNGGSEDWFHSAWADVTATGSVTVRFARTQTSASFFGYAVILVRGGIAGSSGIGASGSTAVGSTETISLTGTSGSVVAYLGIDWDGAALPTGYAPLDGVTEIQRQQNSPNISYTCAAWMNVAAGAVSYGSDGTNAGTKLKSVAVEVLASQPAATGLPILVMTRRLI